MPRTYTTSGVTLPGDGEESGVWGQLTNTNMQILDRMISQAGAISLSGTTHTLTISDGTLSDGQYGVLVFGGSPSGTNTVTISPNDAKRIFIVKNGSGQTVTMTQGSGGNASVSNGRTAIVYCDGAGSGAAVIDVSAAFVASTVRDIGALTPTAGDLIVGNGSTWVASTSLTDIEITGLTSVGDAYFSSGNIGVGTLSPAQDVHISTTVPTIRLEDSDGTDQTLDIRETNGFAQFITRNGTSFGAMQFRRTDGTDNFQAFGVSSGGDFLFYEDDGATIGARFDASSGFFGIGTSPTTALEVSGTITATDYAGDGSSLTGVASDTTQAEATWEAGTGTTESIVSPAKVKAAIDALAVGVGAGQTWQDVLSSRSGGGTPYQNTTGKPIMVSVTTLYLGDAVEVSSDGTTWISLAYTTSDRGHPDTQQFIVPDNHYYRVNAGTITRWAELR